MASTVENVFRCAEVGILEQTPAAFLESRFFPSKVGGKPAWLDLKNLPNDNDLLCSVCGKPCVFLCQVYTPSDDEDSYHRAIFVFICPNPHCCKNNENKNLKVFRCQLPLINEFYPQEHPERSVSWRTEIRVENFTKVCALCGNPGRKNCIQCKVAYCSRDHQILDWKLYGHRVTCNKAGASYKVEVPFLFPEFEIWLDLVEQDDDSDREKTEEEALEEYENYMERGPITSLSHLSLKDLEPFSSVRDDKYFDGYKKWMSLCPDQVLRYDRGGQAIYITKPTEDIVIPNCELCGEKRVFEFQILSSFLNELAHYETFSELDWGTLLIYTCSGNCNGDPAYKSEFIYKQDIVE